MNKTRTLCLGLLYVLSATYSPFALSQNIAQQERADHKLVNIAVYKPAQNCQGVAIISHGAGGSESGYAYLAKFLQTKNWLSLVPGHQESGIAGLRQHIRGKAIKAGLADLIIDSEAYRGRFMDIQAALTLAQQICDSTPRILIGHSMGAATTMLAAGAKNQLQLATPPFQFDGYLALSPQGVGSIFPPHAWQNISHKVLVMTGTRDTELGGAPWQTRLDAYSDMHAACQWSAVIEGATHMSFAGNTNSDKEQQLITSTIWRFIQAMQQTPCTLPKLDKADEGLTLRGR